MGEGGKQGSNEEHRRQEGGCKSCSAAACWAVEFSILQLSAVLWRNSSALPQKRSVHLPGRATALPKLANSDSVKPLQSLCGSVTVAVITTQMRNCRRHNVSRHTREAGREESSPMWSNRCPAPSSPASHTSSSEQQWHLLLETSTTHTARCTKGL